MDKIWYEYFEDDAYGDCEEKETYYPHDKLYYQGYCEYFIDAISKEGVESTYAKLETDFLVKEDEGNDDQEDMKEQWEGECVVFFICFWWLFFKIKFGEMNRSIAKIQMIRMAPGKIIPFSLFGA